MTNVLALFVMCKWVIVYFTVPSNRQLDPIVLKGSDLAELLGTPIGQILGFNFDPNARNSNQWTQVPIQIDEMHYQSWETIKNEPDCRKVLNYTILKPLGFWLEFSLIFSLEFSMEFSLEFSLELSWCKNCHKSNCRLLILSMMILPQEMQFLFL